MGEALRKHFTKERSFVVLKSKKLVSMFLTTAMILSVSCMSAFATDTSISSKSADKSESGQTVSTNARYFAEVNGECKEVTKEEYEKLGKKYFAQVNGELKQVTKEEFERITKESNQKEEEFLAKKKNQEANGHTVFSSLISPLSLVKLTDWIFYEQSYGSNIDTSLFNYTAGNSNKRITLNLRQWRSSGSTNNASARYCIRGRNPSGDLMYYGEQDVTGYYPDGSGSSCKIYFTMPYSDINNVFVRIKMIDNYDISGYGEAYNY
jgi:hypothetical protein